MSYGVFNDEKPDFHPGWPCWRPSIAQMGRANRGLYSAFVRATGVDSWPPKRPLWTIFFYLLYVHLPSGSKNREKLEKKWLGYMGLKFFFSKIHILYIDYRVIRDGDLEFRGPIRWKCSGKNFVAHGMGNFDILCTFWKIDFLPELDTSNIISESNSLPMKTIC